ncbi:hypothetical protein ANCCAN_09844 [Ancylostoma caninum]|uniref:Uncharacterized protein n=1 Tax=Ancylostoma caninum TaxID=29170 RepID=A0A368GIF7_ANCCA|nr:hypothetical protein ANCCAN_09844 [Ancylostoma caninum]
MSQIDWPIDFAKNPQEALNFCEGRVNSETQAALISQIDTYVEIDNKRKHYFYIGMCPCSCSQICCNSPGFSINSCPSLGDYTILMNETSDRTTASSTKSTNKRVPITLERNEIASTILTVTSTTPVEGTVSTKKILATTDETTTQLATSEAFLLHSQHSSQSSPASTVPVHNFFSSTASELKTEDTWVDPDGYASEESSQSRQTSNAVYETSSSFQSENERNEGNLEEENKMETLPSVPSNPTSLKTSRPSASTGLTLHPLSEDVSTASASHDPDTSTNSMSGFETTSHATTSKRTKMYTKVSLLPISPSLNVDSMDTQMTTVPTAKTTEKSTNGKSNSFPSVKMSTSVEAGVSLGDGRTTAARTFDEITARTTTSNAMSAEHSENLMLHESHPSTESENELGVTILTSLTVFHTNSGESYRTKEVVGSVASNYFTKATEDRIIAESTLRDDAGSAINSEESSPVESTDSKESHSTSTVNARCSKGKLIVGSTNIVDDNASSVVPEPPSEVLNASLEVEGPAGGTSSSMNTRYTSETTARVESESFSKKEPGILTTIESTMGENAQNSVQGSGAGYSVHITLPSIEELGKSSALVPSFAQIGVNSGEVTGVDHKIPSTLIQTTSPVAAVSSQNSTYSSTVTATSIRLTSGAYEMTEWHASRRMTREGKTTGGHSADEETKADKTTEGHTTSEVYYGNEKTEGHVTQEPIREKESTEKHTANELSDGGRTTKERAADELTKAGKTTEKHVTHAPNHRYENTEKQATSEVIREEKTTERHTADQPTNTGKVTGETTEGHTVDELTNIGRTTEGRTSDEVTNALETGEGHKDAEITSAGKTNGHVTHELNHGYEQTEGQVTQELIRGEITTKRHTSDELTDARTTKEGHAGDVLNYGYKKTEGHVTGGPTRRGETTEEHTNHEQTDVDSSEVKTRADALLVTSMAAITTNTTSKDETSSTFAESPAGTANGHLNKLETTYLPTSYFNSTMTPWLTELTNPVTDVFLSTFLVSSLNKVDSLTETRHQQTYRSSQITFTDGNGVADGSTTEHRAFSISTFPNPTETALNPHKQSTAKDTKRFNIDSFTTELGARIPTVSSKSHGFTAATQHSPSEQGMVDRDEPVLHTTSESRGEIVHDGVTSRWKLRSFVHQPQYAAKLLLSTPYPLPTRARKVTIR